MNVQLAKVQSELQEATARVRHLAERLPDAIWRRRPNEPPYRLRIKTPSTFDPQEVDSAESVMRDWDRLERELFRRIDAADGLALDKVQVVSPFAKGMKYSLLAALMVIPAHQRRHTWQAEQVLRSFS